MRAGAGSRESVGQVEFCLSDSGRGCNRGVVFPDKKVLDGSAI